MSYSFSLFNEWAFCKLHFSRYWENELFVSHIPCFLANVLFVNYIYHYLANKLFASYISHFLANQLFISNSSRFCEKWAFRKLFSFSLFSGWAFISCPRANELFVSYDFINSLLRGIFSGYSCLSACLYFLHSIGMKTSTTINLATKTTLKSALIWFVLLKTTTVVIASLQRSISMERDVALYRR